MTDQKSAVALYGKEAKDLGQQSIWYSNTNGSQTWALGKGGEFHELQSNSTISAVSTVADVTSNTIVPVAEAGFSTAGRILSGAGATAAELSDVAMASKVVGTAGKVLGAAGIGLTILDAATSERGFTTKHAIDLTMGLLDLFQGQAQRSELHGLLGI